MKKLLIFMLFLFCINPLSYGGSKNLYWTKGDTETIVFSFVDGNGADYDISSNTFTFQVGTDEKSSDVYIATGNSFTLDGNDAILEVSTSDTDQDLGRYFWDGFFVDGSNKKSTFGTGALFVTNRTGGYSNSGNTIIGTTNVTVQMDVAYGTQDAFGSNYTAKGDIISGAGVASFNVLSVGSNGQLLSADSTQAGGVKWITASGTGDMNTSTYDTDTNGIVDNSERIDLVTHNYTSLADDDIITYDNGTASFINESIAEAGIVPSGDFTTHTGDSTIHFTQASISIPASQISDFDTEVANNTDVATNTTHRGLTNNPHSVDETDILPDQTGNSGLYLTTNGSSSSWAAVAGGFTSFDAAGDTGTPQEITDGNTLTIAGGTGVSTVAGATDTITLSTVDSEIVHDNTSGFVSNEHIDHSGVTMTAGTGLTGGGDITTGRTFNVDVGIADDKILQMDQAAGASDNDYAKFTASGIEGRTYSEVKTDLSLDNVENTALSTWTGSTSITTIGTIGTGTWQGTAVADTYVANDLTIVGGSVDSTSTLTNTAVSGQLYFDGNDQSPTTKNITIDWADGTMHTIDLQSAGDDIDITLSTVATHNVIAVLFEQGSTARQINSITPAVTWSSGVTPSITTTNNARTKIVFAKWPDGTVTGEDGNGQFYE